MTKISEALGQYTDICKEAIMESAVKLSKSFDKIIIEMIDNLKLNLYTINIHQ